MLFLHHNDCYYADCKKLPGSNVAWHRTLINAHLYTAGTWQYPLLSLRSFPPVVAVGLSDTRLCIYVRQSTSPLTHHLSVVRHHVVQGLLVEGTDIEIE